MTKQQAKELVDKGLRDIGWATGTPEATAVLRDIVWAAFWAGYRSGKAGDDDTERP